MNDHLTNAAIEWFFAQPDAMLKCYDGEWDLRIGNNYFMQSHDPVGLLEEAYDDLYLAPARHAMSMENRDE